ncbi:MAG: type I-E CRISPR-associated endoribonuclease Cas2e [Oscillospiraceae bacterium]|nr:type I-E CRISPR-associated endoribonuclease Cas2e [Oscillospiraceae bacterium]
MVLHLTNCPPALRGDLTKWLMEIASGVYVGRVSARVRDNLWDRVVDTCKSGRAVLVFSANNEQRMDFRIHGETWEPVDFDGLKLILRPSPARISENRSKHAYSEKSGFSNASKFQRAKKYSKNHNKNAEGVPSKSQEVAEIEYEMLESYVIIDIETTGLNPTDCEIIDIGALKVKNGEVVDEFQSFVSIKKPLPEKIIELTGITDITLNGCGKPLKSVMENFLVFIKDLPIVAHNVKFDLSFINIALKKCGQEQLTNRVVDTLEVAKKVDKKFVSYKLTNLIKELNIDVEKLAQSGYTPHSSFGDCHLTLLLFQKLIKLGGQEG